ncbi:hypothetical protein BY458DRAFT_520521 [Sporodiniella umbellata]|nr:hypothetical protein BY458DRAFT_520521 [Sporodiniella umbellata]
MSIQEFLPGDIVFAKLKGYPWWPARVEDDRDIPAGVLKQKSKSKGLLYTVLFYGTQDYGFFGPDSVRRFEKEQVDRDLKAKKYRTKGLERAIHQALDPHFVETEKDKRGKKRLSMEVSMEETKKSKGLKEKHVEVLKSSAEFKKVYRIRHKLQRLVYEKEPGKIPKEDYAKISDIVEEIKALPLTVDLIRHTKIARVLSCALNYSFDGDNLSINENCSQLLKSWRSIVDDCRC